MQFEIKDLTPVSVKRPALYVDAVNPNNIVLVHSFSNGNVGYVYLTGVHIGDQSTMTSSSFLSTFKYFAGELYLTN
jgi:hypothetical protein